MTRRWTVGDRVTVDGLELRVVQGHKGPHDQRLELWHDGRWQPVTLGLAFVLVDCIGQNEDVLYPHGRGGGKTVTDVKAAYRDGWRAAWSQLQRERARRDLLELQSLNDAEL